MLPFGSFFMFTQTVKSPSPRRNRPYSPVLTLCQSQMVPSFMFHRFRSASLCSTQRAFKAQLTFSDQFPSALAAVRFLRILGRNIGDLIIRRSSGMPMIAFIIFTAL